MGLRFQKNKIIKSLFLLCSLFSSKIFSAAKIMNEDRADVSQDLSLIDYEEISKNSDKLQLNRLLIQAVKDGKKDLVQLLINLNADINTIDEDSNSTPLQIAISRGNMSMVKLLFNNNATLPSTDNVDSVNTVNLIVNERQRRTRSQGLLNWKINRVNYKINEHLNSFLPSDLINIIKSYYISPLIEYDKLKDLLNALLSTRNSNSKKLQEIEWHLTRGLDIDEFFNINESGESALMQMIRADLPLEIYETLLTTGAQIGLNQRDLMSAINYLLNEIRIRTERIINNYRTLRILHIASREDHRSDDLIHNEINLNSRKIEEIDNIIELLIEKLVNVNEQDQGHDQYIEHLDNYVSNVERSKKTLHAQKVSESNLYEQILLERRRLINNANNDALLQMNLDSSNGAAISSGDNTTRPDDLIINQNNIQQPQVVNTSIVNNLPTITITQSTTQVQPRIEPLVSTNNIQQAINRGSEIPATQTRISKIQKKKLIIGLASLALLSYIIAKIVSEEDQEDKKKDSEKLLLKKA